jgi:ferritin
MLSDKMLKALNEQINFELNSAYLYLSMATHFDDANLPGFAHWMQMQWQEEVSHGMKLLTYVHDSDAKVTLEQIDKPQEKFGSPLEVFEQVLAHEQKVTAAISSIYAQALDEKDFATQSHLQWFINEQVEEEATARDIIEKLKRIEGHDYLLYEIDRELGGRSAPAASAE